MALEERTIENKTSTEIRTYKYDSHVRPRLEEVYGTKEGADI